jgi:hypothetical protein
MGFYELICDCGCVSISSSLDNFAGYSYSIVCDEHKLEVGKEFTYDLNAFYARYGVNQPQSRFKKVKILDIKYHTSNKTSRKHTLVKMKVFDFDISTLKSSKINYFSEFEDEPSFQQDEKDAILIDIFNDSYISGRKEMSSEKMKKEGVYYDWHKNKLIYSNI